MRNLNKVSIFAAVLACFFIFCTFVPAYAASRIAKLVYVEGDVEVQKPGGEWSKASLDMNLEKDDSVRTGNDSIAEIELDDGSTVKLGEETTIAILSLDEIGPAKEKVSIFNLILGEIKATVLKILGKKAGFEVQTPACIAGVRGTDFIVSAEADEAANVEVLDGNVVVEGIGLYGERGAPLEIKAGLSSRIEKGKPPMPGQKIEAYRRARWELWNSRRNIFVLARELENANERARLLRIKYALAKTDQEKREIQKQAEALKKIIVKTCEEMKKRKQEFLKNRERLEKEIEKAVEKWKSLPPEQRARIRMNYELWRNIARARLALMRRERARETLARWKNLPPEAKARLVRALKFWRSLPPEQRKIILLKIRQFRQLPPWVQKRIIENYRKWKSLPPGQRKKIIESYKKWRKLPPGLREDIKDRIERFKNLPPDKKLQILKFHRLWQKKINGTGSFLKGR